MPCSLNYLEGNKIAHLVLNNPERRNALNDDMINEIVKNLELINQDPKVRVLLISAKGKSFSAGGDIKAMANKSEMFEGSSNDLRVSYEFGIQKIARAMERFRKPMIAVVHAGAVGAGADFATMADMRIGCENTFFAETFNHLALVPGDGGTYFLPRVIGYPKAMELFLTGRRVDSEEALKLGLLNQIFSSEKLLDEGVSLAKKIAEKPPIALEMTKKALKHSWKTRDLESSLDLLSAYQGITQRTEDHERGLNAFFKKKKLPSLKGINEVSCFIPTLFMWFYKV